MRGGVTSGLSSLGAFCHVQHLLPESLLTWTPGKPSICVHVCLCVLGGVGVGMLSPELENQGGKSCREDSDKSLHLLMAAQAMKKRSQAGGQGSFLVSSSFSISSGQESVRRSQSGRAVV